MSQSPLLLDALMAGGLLVAWALMAPAALRRRRAALIADGPDPTVVYRLYDASGRLLYVGISRCMERRMRQHAADKAWWPEVADTKTRLYRTRAAAARAEHAAICRESPRCNVRRLGRAAHLRSARTQ